MTDNPIPYVFVWSDNYKVFAECLQTSIRHYSNALIDQSEYIPQSEFDKTIYKIDGHVLNGCFIKLEKTLECLYTLPEDSYFIFSDADIIISPNKKFIELLNYYRSIEADIVFMRESLTHDFSNIGFSFIRVNNHTRDLFRNALLLAKEDPTNADGNLVNQALKNYTGSHYYFPSELVATTSTMMEFEFRGGINYFTHIRQNCIVFQPICNPGQTKEQIIMQKLAQYKELNIQI
jgi:hypothetical protein